MGSIGAVEESQEPGKSLPVGASIQVVKGFYEGLALSIDREWLVIGRGRSADVVIAEPTISRAHAAIGYDDEGFFMQDLGSTNGTRVNGESHSRVHLSDGDELLLGKLHLRVALPSATAS